MHCSVLAATDFLNSLSIRGSTIYFQRAGISIISQHLSAHRMGANRALSCIFSNYHYYYYLFWACNQVGGRAEWWYRSLAFHGGRIAQIWNLAHLDWIGFNRPISFLLAEPTAGNDGCWIEGSSNHLTTFTFRAFCRPRWMLEINPKSVGTVPSGVAC